MRTNTYKKTNKLYQKLAFTFTLVLLRAKYSLKSVKRAWLSIPPTRCSWYFCWNVHWGVIVCTVTRLTNIRLSKRPLNPVLSTGPLRGIILNFRFQRALKYTNKQGFLQVSLKSTERLKFGRVLKLKQKKLSLKHLEKTDIWVPFQHLQFQTLNLFLLLLCQNSHCNMIKCTLNHNFKIIKPYIVSCKFQISIRQYIRFYLSTNVFENNVFIDGYLHNLKCLKSLCKYRVDENLVFENDCRPTKIKIIYMGLFIFEIYYLSNI